MRNNSSDSRIDKIQEVGKDLVDLGFLKQAISNEISDMLTRRDHLHHQVRKKAFNFNNLPPLLLEIFFSN